MDFSDAETLRLNMNIKELKAKLDSVSAQNTRLSIENSKLQFNNQKLENERDIAANVNIELKLQIHRIESEREDIYQSLKYLKIKYNKLHEKYLVNNKRLLVLEDVFKKQKTLPNLVPKGIIRNLQEKETNLETTNTKHLEEKIMQLEQELFEANDIIDGLEFEIESIDLLESENEYLQNELKKLKRDATKQQQPDEPHSIQGKTFEDHNIVLRDHQYDDHHPSREANDIDEVDRITSIIKDPMIEADIQKESSSLRRDLLRHKIVVRQKRMSKLYN